MTPFGIPPVAPALSLAELLGPFAPFALIPVVAVLAVILGLVALRPLEGRGTGGTRITTARRPQAAPSLRPAA